MYAERVWYNVWRDAAQVEIEALFQRCPSLRCSEMVVGYQALRMKSSGEEGTELGILQ